MGVDHGLGGRESQKGKDKRKKKQARTKTEILRTICDDSQLLKKEVVFNEDARRDWLTGFNKRKQKRRQFGVAMQVIKEHKKLKEAQASRRVATKQTHDDAIAFAAKQKEDEFRMDHDAMDSEEEDEDDEEKEEGSGTSIGDVVITEEEQTYDDDHTQSMFGNSIAVTIDSTGIANELDEYRSVYKHNNIDPETAAANRLSHKQEVFDKAIKVAKKKMADKKMLKKMKGKLDKDRVRNNGNMSKKQTKGMEKMNKGKKLVKKAMGKK